MKTLFRNLKEYVTFKDPRDPLDILISISLWFVFVLVLINLISRI